MTGARQRGKARAAWKGSSKGSIYSVDEASDSDWWTQSDRSQLSSQPEEGHSLLHAGSEQMCKVNDMSVHPEEDAGERMDTMKTQEHLKERHRQRRGVNTHNTYQAVSFLETVKEEDEREESI